MNWERANRWRASAGSMAAGVGWLAPSGTVTGAPRGPVLPAAEQKRSPVIAELADKVTVRFPDGEEETYTLVDVMRGGAHELDVLSPLGWCLWEAEEHDEPICDAPDGPYRVTVLRIERRLASEGRLGWTGTAGRTRQPANAQRSPVPGSIRVRR